MAKKSRKRKNGDGTVYRRKSDGLFIAAISVDGCRWTDSAATREEADDLLEQLKVRSRAPRNTPGRETVDDCVERNLARQEVELTTIEWRRSAWRKHGLPRLGSLPIHKLTPLDVADWVAEMNRAGVGKRARQVAFDVLRNSMKAAVALGQLRSDPTVGVKRPKCERDEIEVFTPSEVKRILQDVREHRNAAVYYLAFGAGLRQGEIFGLQWTDFDPQTGVIEIRRQVVEARGKQIIRPKPKTQSGFRRIQLPPTVVAVLQERRKTAMAEGQAAVEWICTTEAGNPWRRSNFAVRHWQPLLKRLGLRKRGLHHARHSTATLMLRSQVPAHIVSAVIGHKQTSTTLDIYAHALPGDQSGALAIVEQQIAVAKPLLNGGSQPGPSGEGKTKSG